MNRNDRARKLITLGSREAVLMQRLAAVQEERCQLLQGAMEEACLEPDVIALGIAPKTPPQ